MKRLTTILLLSLFSMGFAYSQSSFLKYIEKGKYPKAEKKIMKALSKDSNDVGNNYAYAMLLSKRKYKEYNCEKAYITLLKSKQGFETITDEKQLAKLAKVPITIELYRNQLDTICQQALEDAMLLNTVSDYNHYLLFFTKAQPSYALDATERRNLVAYSDACKLNTIASYQEFITKYPHAKQQEEAKNKRNAIAFQNAKLIDKIDSYEVFIRDYPFANEVTEATERIHELAYSEAEKENNATAYKKFIDSYSESKQYKKAFSLYEEKSFLETTIAGDWLSYQTFIESYPTNQWKSSAQDSIFKIAMETENVHTLAYCVVNLSGDKKTKSLFLLHDVYTHDGETQTLNRFYSTFDDEQLAVIKEQDFAIATLGDNLMLHLPYNSSNFYAYDEYIKAAAPREKAFVALQRMIAPDIQSKNFKSAINKTNAYLSFFGTKSKKLTDLIAILNAKWNNSIKINSVGNGINTSSGGEYVPVISTDDKLLYFCGKDRKDNVGGEDIFVSQKNKGIWTSAKVVPDLSSPNSNDAPLSVSSDGTTMLLFKSGKIYYSEKSASGWGEAIPFPDNINASNWQSDAMISSNGKALIFSSTKPGGFNLYSDPQKIHGDNLYPSDIYVSLLDANNNWGDPINLGSNINTPFCDRMPFLHPDMKTLYFSSDGHGGLGKMDVFKSTRLADTCWNCWSEPTNLGIEINTTESDAGYKIATSGDKAYFSYEKKSFEESSVLFLLDVSGSMAGDKIEALKTATISVCETALDNNAEVSILVFDGDCNNPITNLYPFTKDLAALTEFVQNINARGSTPMYEAYYTACDYMKHYSNPKNKNKVITLMTDGNANGCITLDYVLKTLKIKGLVYKTQTIAYDVNEYSQAYLDLQNISSFSKGKFYAAQGKDDLGSTFENANNDIFNISSTANNRDIYWLNLPPSMRPDYVATISGKLVDKKNQPVAAEIRWEDLESGKSIGQSKSDPADGSFFIVLPLGKIYGYYVDKDQHFPISNNIDLRKNDKPVQIVENIDIVTFKQMVEDSVAVPVNNLFFKFAESMLLPYSIPELKRIAKIIIDNNLKVEICGHTDNIGDDAQNQILSEKRANSVKEFLITAGCNTDKLITRGFGKTQPVASNDTEKGRAKNRRVELKFVP